MEVKKQSDNWFDSEIMDLGGKLLTKQSFSFL